MDSTEEHTNTPRTGTSFSPPSTTFQARFVSRQPHFRWSVRSFLFAMVVVASIASLGVPKTSPAPSQVIGVILAAVVCVVVFMLHGASLLMAGILGYAATVLGGWMVLAPPMEAGTYRIVIAVVIVATALVLRRLDRPDILTDVDPFRSSAAESGESDTEENTSPD